MSRGFTTEAPTKGCVVHCRSHHHLVEDVQPPEDGGDTVVRLACLDDDANGQITEVFWEREVDARVLGQSTWETIGQRGFDDPRVFSSYPHTLQWNCVTATDPGLFQAPLRAGIDVKPYQLEPLRKALRMPRVSQFIADEEANAFVKVLQEQRDRILKSRTKHDSEFEQLAFGFADQELGQLRGNRSYWDKWLARIERDLELEPAAIRRAFEVATAPRIEPAGTIVLWPLQVAP